MAKFINYDDTNKVFHLKNHEISYLFQVEEGNLLHHIYFGEKIDIYRGGKSYPRIGRGFSGNLVDSTNHGFSKDTLPQEFSSNDSGDYRTPAAIIQWPNGSKTSSFIYKTHEIIAGKPVLSGLPSAYVNDTEEAETLIVTLADEYESIEIDLLYTIYKERNIIARSSRIRNLSNQTIRLEKLASMQIDFAANDYEVISLPGAHVRERQIQREVITHGIKSFESVRGTSSHLMNSFIALVNSSTDEFTGQAIGFNLVYSGNHSFQLEKDQAGQLRVVAGINERKFSWLLNPNEEFQTPEILIAYSSNGLNEMSNTYHKIIRERVCRGKYQYAERPILVNNWEATYFNFNEDKLIPIVDEAAKMGIEMFVLDDGWFGNRDDDNSSLGDWVVFEKKFPRGLNHFADYVHSKGLKFGLWFEPEMISMESELFRNNPDYVLSVPNRSPHPSRNQFVLDMGRKEVRENIKSQIKEILDRVDIDYIKWDMNRHLTDVYSAVMNENSQGEVHHRYVLGLYELLEDLTTSYPNILWEGCSGGGGRFDSGFAYYMPQSWTSDNTDAIARLKIQYGTSLAYPISTMTSHVSAVPNHQTGRSTSIQMRGAVAMSGVFGYELDLTMLKDEEKITIADQVKTYQKIRPLIQYGTFIRLRSPFEDNNPSWMFVSPDQTEAIVFVFQVLSEAQPVLRQTRLVGLDPNKTYGNVNTGTLHGGDELMNLGFFDELIREDFGVAIHHFKEI